MGLFSLESYIQTNYGFFLVEGSIGAGKTKNTFEDCLIFKQTVPGGIVIGNVPYDFVDIKYDSFEDFRLILQYLKRYMIDTNDNDSLKNNFPPLRLIIDEAHLYFFSRDFLKFDKNLLLLLTQCRKRGVGIYIITQSRSQVDTLVRNLAVNSIYYTFVNFVLFTFVRREMLYFASPDVVNPDLADKWDGSILLPRWYQKWMYRKELEPLWNQKYLTKYVVGLDHRLHEKVLSDDGTPRYSKTGDILIKPVYSYEMFLSDIGVSLLDDEPFLEEKIEVQEENKIEIEDNLEIESSINGFTTFKSRKLEDNV